MKKIVKRLFLPLMLCGAISSVSAAVVVNEAMPSNLNTVMDKETYQYSAWVELYNNGSAPVNINGYTILYKPLEVDTIKEHVIDYDCKIDSAGYILLFFDKVAGIKKHISYKLDADGGEISLMDPSGKIVSTLKVPDICSYVSYGVGKSGVGYMEPTPGKKNDTAYVATSLKAFQTSHQCAAPTFNKNGGVYANTELMTITLSSTTAGAKIYYTTDGTVPTKENGKLYEDGIDIAKTFVIRARAYANGKVCSPVATASFILDDKKHSYCNSLGKLPIVSVVTDKKNFDSDTYGIGVKGSNGIKGICDLTGVANYNQDWKRPMNFEFIVDGKTVINHELEGKVMGGCSRQYKTKSLALCASKKCGSGKNKMKYAFFEDKPAATKYKSLHLRNGGNDYDGLRFRDGIMQSFIHGANIDYQAYRPVGYYLNGEYQGLMLLNEHTNSDYLYSNYDLDEEDIDLIKHYKNEFVVTEGTIDAYNKLLTEAQTGQNTSGYYEKMNKLMDMDEYMNYMAFEQFIVNTDWPGNNLKFWRNRNNGRFRWIVYDTDFGFGMYEGWAPNYTNYSTNMIKFSAGEGDAVNWGNGSSNSPYKFDEKSKWKTILFSSLMKDDEFKNKFMTKNLMMLQTYFKSDILRAKIDSVAKDAYPEYCAMVANEHWQPNFEDEDELKAMREFAEKRPQYVLEHLASYMGGSPIKLNITSNVAGTDWVINGMYWSKDSYESKYISNQPLTVTAIAPAGYVFKNWKLSSAPSSKLLTSSSEWDYLYNKEGAAEGWNKSGFETEGWLKGTGSFGYGPNDYTTALKYGEDADDKPITGYFRTSVDIDNLEDYEKFTAKISYDDGYILYINGTEVSRENISSDSVVYSTLADDYTNDEVKEISIASKYFVAGKNVVAVEVHQNTPTSSDFTFAMSLNAVGKASGATSKDVTYKTTVSDDYTMEAVFEKNAEVKQIFINEICTSNQRTVENKEVAEGYVLGYADEYGKYGDWIELYNAGDVDVNIAGWYISDNAAKPTKYRIPTTDPNATIVPAHDYKMIWCDNDTWNGPLHVDFKLGDTKVNNIVLSSKPTTIVDSLTTIINIGTNQTYGRATDGSSERHYFKNNCKTPMAANGSVENCVTSEENPMIKLPNTIAIYPNPVDEQLNITSTVEAIKKVVIYDNIGRQIFIDTYNSNEVSVNTSNLASGIYQINIVTEGNNTRLKFIKK